MLRNSTTGSYAPGSGGATIALYRTDFLSGPLMKPGGLSLPLSSWNLKRSSGTFDMSVAGMINPWDCLCLPASLDWPLRVLP